MIRSVLEGEAEEASKPTSQLTGPGGRPLPRTDSPSLKPKLSEERLDLSSGRKFFFVIMSIILQLTFLGNAVIAVTHALTHQHENWWCGEAYVIYIVGTFFLYCLVLISIIDTRPSPDTCHAITWTVSVILEVLLAGSSFVLFSSSHREPNAFDPNGGEAHVGFTQWEAAQIFLDVVRIACLFLLVAFYLLFVFLGHWKADQSHHNENGQVNERTSLLKNHVNGNHEHSDAENKEVAGWERPKKLPTKSWWQYIKGYSLFFQYLWPSQNRRLQIIAGICFFLLLVSRIINLFVPYQVGKVVDLLGAEDWHHPNIPWLQILLLIVLRFSQGSSGIVTNIRTALWIPINQYSYRELSVAIFEHVHNLSLDFHLGKRTGEVTSAMKKGNSINTFLESVTFQIVPMIVDLAIALVYFIHEFDIYYALIVALVSVLYMYLTIRMAQWRSDVKREVTNLGREEEAVKTDSMTAYETVKYFNAEEYEFARYRDVVDRFQVKEYILLKTLSLMNIVQNLCFTVGLMASCFLAAFQISMGLLGVGKFVALLTYMGQLQQPLNYFGTFYRSIQTAMINSERLLELFKEQPTVVDQPWVGSLTSCRGKVRFNNVEFSYDPRRPALQGLSFLCKPGTRTALVGESGGGKSTVFRLLFRFYNVLSGSIEIDDHNIEDISVDSLRSHIGVVPQEVVLFNESVMYNLKYANQSATEAEVYAACKAACIHDQILDFPEGYNAMVGERGMKLSGGEKQRLSIARAILKNPPIILLDEATASLDSETEQHIQEALVKLSQGRTTFVIAHRLSTIINADQILVLHKGRVAEAGTHDQLMDLGEKYAKMWERQVNSQDIVFQAKARKRYHKVLTPTSSAHVSDDEGRDIPLGYRTPAEDGLLSRTL
ncbi:uncharacterized protein KY384_001478 [Bacidia gigantensis]|uniref:uncharacterized protein n=1 Tax=Bacidia gigantensis TaxID=2732470 RepID=UPI001D04A490|nr:uncharacterized protein KY384_001478 [Bacidia gigantensis]KAG8533737.1 hypothetical protein KY384_001478 [Bacidia gigantensis]